MEKLFGKYKNNIFQVAGFILFLCLVILVFCKLTYLFRGNEYGYDDRIAVVGIKEEEKNSLDMIYIGGSAAFTYWEPLKAYSDCGFTSYDLAANSIQAEHILPLIKYAQKYQNPELYVIGVRSFQYYSEQGNEIGLRVTADALDIGVNRAKLIKQYLSNRTMDTDELALYWDIAKYHTNIEALKNPMAWKLIDNSEKSRKKGAGIRTSWTYLEPPRDFQTEERAALLPKAEETLFELLEYCKGQDLNVLFVVCPYYLSQQEYSIYNRIGDIVSSYDYPFLNTNDYYDEMGIDFAEDFYNVDHVNSLGAAKYTNFLETYLTENYNLPDHRQDEKYAEWSDLADEYAKVMEESENGVRSWIATAKQAVSLKENIIGTDNFASWTNLVNDSRYTIICIGDSSGFTGSSYENKKIFQQMGWTGIETGGQFFNASCGASALESEVDENGNYVVNIMEEGLQTSCVVGNAEHGYSITIDGEEYSRKNQKGINVVVIDNKYRTIMDSISLVCDKDGEVSVCR